MEKVNISKETIVQSIGEGATSISGIWKSIGGKGNISGSTVNKIKLLVPDIQDRLNANKNANKAPKPATEKPIANKAVNPAKPAPTTPKKQAKQPKPAKAPYSKYPRHPQNPYRPGSSYGTAFDILAIKKAGISRDELTNLLSKENGKDEKHAAYDLSVVISAAESPTGPRHRSAKDGYWVKREYHHYTLMLS